jgi:hypothetical protein
MVTNNSCDYQPTQYNVQTGGANGTLNNVAPSTSGFVLTSNGASSQPTFQANPVSSFQVKNQVFTSTGTYTPTSGMVYCQITVLGGGGAGGGAATTGVGTQSGGGGGGAGEYAVGIFTAATIGASQAVTIAAAAAGVSGTTGNNGGTCSVGSLITAAGGSGGTTVAAGANGETAGGLGGTGGSGGDYRTPGSPGGTTAFLSGSFNFSGLGANSQLGAGGLNIFAVSVNGNPGLGYGSGGSGAFGGNSVAKTGGNGAPGIVIIQEYIT